MSDTSPLQSDQENALQAALTSAFSTTDIPLILPETPKTEPALTTTEEQPLTASSEATPSDAKDEYEENISKWQHENALQREKAEKVRKEWEDRRASGEKFPETDEYLGAHLAKVQNKVEGGWEKVEDEKVGEVRVGSPSPVDGRDFVSEKPDVKQLEASAFVRSMYNILIVLQSELPGANPSASASTSTIQPGAEHPPERSQNRSPSNSEKWDSFPGSMASSYPSLSFPDSGSSPREKPSSEPHHGHSASHGEHRDHHHSHSSHEHPKPPASLSVFDTNLSTKTRVIALLGSLAINLALPFINGVMLGFGEIFSENVLFKYFGWKKTLGRTSVPGSVGLRK